MYNSHLAQTCYAEGSKLLPDLPANLDANVIVAFQVTILQTDNTRKPWKCIVNMKLEVYKD